MLNKVPHHHTTFVQRISIFFSFFGHIMESRIVLFSHHAIKKLHVKNLLIKKNKINIVFFGIKLFRKFNF
jgi:hypothetical protein